MSTSICEIYSSYNGGRSGELLDLLQITEMRDLKSFSSCHSYPPGTLLFVEEQQPEKVFMLLDGQVKLSVDSSDGKRFILRIAEPGEILGLESALTGKPYEMTAETFYSCKIASIGSTDLLEFLARHPSAFKCIALSLSNSYARACARFRTMSGTPTVAAKLARLLLEFSASGQQTERGTTLHLTLTHEEIAACVGTCRESVSRVLCDFRRRNLIARRGSILTITNRSSLERCAAS